MRVLEFDVEKSIIQYLELHGCIVEKTDAGATAKRTRGQIKFSDLPSGTFDLTVLYRGMGFKLECKRPNGKTRAKQLLMKQRLDDAKIPNLIVNDLDVLVRWLRENIPGRWQNIS